MKQARTWIRWVAGFSLLSQVACSGSNDSHGKTTDATSGGSWPSYGHDGQNTRYNPDETTISPKNVAKLVKKWDTKTTGVTHFGVTSTAAVVDDIVYFGDWGGKLHAVDAQTGKKVWSTQVSKDTTGLDAQLNDSPFVTEDRIYLGGTQNHLYAVDRKTGKKVWNPSVVIGDQPQVILWSSPNVVDGTLLIGVGSFQVFLPENPYTFKGNVVGVNADSGKVEWTTFVTDGDNKSGFGCSVWGSAAVDEDTGLAYIGVGQSYSEPASPHSDSVVAIDYKTGKLEWGHQFTKDDVFTVTQSGPDFDVGASVFLYEVDGKKLVGAGDKGGHFYALDRKTGKLVWATELTKGGRTGGVMASPAIAEGVVYVYSNDGIAQNIGSSGPGAGSAFALDGATGKKLWETKMKPGAFGGIAVANGLMFFTTLDGKIHALDAETGKELWKDDLMDGKVGKAAGGVTVVNGMVYAGAGWDWTPLSAPPEGGLTAYGLP